MRSREKFTLRYFSTPQRLVRNTLGNNGIELTHSGYRNRYQRTVVDSTPANTVKLTDEDSDDDSESSNPGETKQRRRHREEELV